MNEYSHRKRNRLSADLYRTPGAYFITICAQDRKCLFWSDTFIEDVHCVPLSALGRIAEEELLRIVEGYAPMLNVSKYAIMPNHVHILFTLKSSPQQACPDMRYVVRLYKRRVSQNAGASIWQKGFYDRIVRNEDEFREIWKYIDENPLKWNLDRYYIKADS